MPYASCLLKVTVCILLAGSTAAAARKGAPKAAPPVASDQGKLIAILQSNAPPADKALACKRLAIVGDGEAVPALAALVPDPELSSWARVALEVSPDSKADDALRAAMGRVRGRLLIGVINSLGVRRDTKSVPLLIERLKDAENDVAAAAAVALGRIGTEPAVAALRQAIKAGPVEVRSAAAEGAILCAEHYVVIGNVAEATKVYDEIRTADLPEQRKLEATRGAILVRGAEGGPLLVEQLRSPAKNPFALGLSVARELPGRAASEALSAALADAPPERQSLLILVLADRGDAGAGPVIVRAASGGPPAVRLKALKALRRIEESVSAPVLLAAALDEDAAISEAAQTVIQGLPGPTIDRLIAEKLSADQAPGKRMLVELAGRRHVAAAASALWKAADDADDAIRRAALAGLGGTIVMDDLPRLIARLRTAKNTEDGDAVVKALQVATPRMPDREACAAKLAEAAADAPPPVKCRLLEVVAALGGPKALACVADAAKQDNEEVCDTAFRVLGQWMSVDAGPVLADLARGAKSQRNKVRAVRGYIRIARQFVMPLPEREAMCRTAFQLAERPEDKRLILEILLRYPSPEMLAMALEAAKSPELKDEATMIAMGIGRAKGGDTTELRKALASAGHQAVKLEIVKAEYGAGTQKKDVTAIVRRCAKSYRVLFLPTATYNDAFGGDPAPGVVKHLKIQYRIDGKDGEVTLNENATIVLPMPR